MNRDLIERDIENLEEQLHIEVKNWLGGLETAEEKSKLVKEIIALSNHGGGYIYIGFDDATKEEIPPQGNEVDAFSQDKLSGLIEKYLTPTCECKVGYFSKKGSEIVHPVIHVSGNNRVPIFSKKDSPDQKTLRQNTIYVRRHGGKSEPVRTQDDWEKLLERLIKSRQGEMLNAVRQAIDPSANPLIEPTDILRKWDLDCFERWNTYLKDLHQEDGRRLLNGYWQFSFSISPFGKQSVSEINKFVSQRVRAYTGWPPFTYLQTPPQEPKPKDEAIEAWLVDSHSEEFYEGYSSADFWCISNDGKGFMIRPFQEDHPDFMASRSPQPQKPIFDKTIPIWRCVECLKFAQAMAIEFGEEDSILEIHFGYYNCIGRTLESHDWNYGFTNYEKSAQDEIHSRHSFPIKELELNLSEKVYLIMRPVFEVFEFHELSKSLVDRIVTKVLDGST